MSNQFSAYRKICIFLFLPQAIKHVDVMFVETLEMFECFMSLAIKYSAPVIGTISVRVWPYSDLAIGNARIASFFPSMYESGGKKVAFLGRLFNFIWEIREKALVFITQRKCNELFQHTFPNQDFHNSKISLMFANDHTCIQERAISPNTINIGGIQVKSAVLSPLPEVSTYLLYLTKLKNNKPLYI